MAFPELNDFRLVGGTALALQFGHRGSDDIDLFTDCVYGTIDFKPINRILKQSFKYVDVGIGEIPSPGKSYFLGDSVREFIKVDIFYTDNFIYPEKKFEGIRFASPEDIAIMKLRVIFSEKGGRKKDFWDLHELTDHFSLESMLDLYNKQPYYETLSAEMLNKLTDFRNAEDDFTPRCCHGKYWELIKLDIEEEVTKLRVSRF